jgi:hypothetical protein
MDSTIVASIISAIASVFVALLSRQGSAGAASGAEGALRTYSIPSRNRNIWAIAVCALVGWTVYAALSLHWDTAAVSVLLIPLVMWVLAAAAPIRPLTAASVVLIQMPFAFLAEPIGKWRSGIPFDNHFEARAVGVFVAVAFGSALIAFLLAKWRAGRYVAKRTAEERNAQGLSTALAKALAELSELHRSGVLSDDEFVRAKGKLLQ